MASALQELRDKRAAALDRARSEFTRLSGEKKTPVEEWNEGDRNTYMGYVDEATRLDDEYKALEKTVNAHNRIEEMFNEQDRPQHPNRPKVNVPDANNRIIQWNNGGQGLKTHNRVWERSSKPTGSEAYNIAFSSYLRGGRFDFNASTGMSSDNEERGGYFQTSESFMSEIIKQVDDAVFVQKLSRVFMMPEAKSLGVRVRRSRASTFTWAGENTDITPTRDTSLAYGKRLLTPNYLQGSTIISRDLIRNVPGAEAMVIEEIGIDLNYKLEPAFLTGDGNQKPMGLLTAHNDGISTSRDQTSTVTKPGFDDWTNMKYSLKGKYRDRATWMVHRYVLNEVALLKDGNGQYLWQPSRQIGFPDMILGTPVVETEWMPYTQSSGQYFAILGDFSYYWIVYEMNMDMQRLIETQAKTNEYEYMFRCKLDAQPVLEEAFSRGKRA